MLIKQGQTPGHGFQVPKSYAAEAAGSFTVVLDEFGETGADLVRDDVDEAAAIDCPGAVKVSL